MGRYLCQLCWSIVHYGERHPCFFYKDDAHVYTVPPPNEPEEMAGKHKETEGIHHAANSYENNEKICSSAEENEMEESTTLLTENNERISLMPPSTPRKSSFSALPSKFLRRINNRPSVSKSASPAKAERGGSKHAPRKSKNPRKSGSAVVAQIGNNSNAPNSVELRSVFDAAAAFEAGPSGVQTQPRNTQIEKPFERDPCVKPFAGWKSLEEHSRTHTGKRPFMCCTCGKAFLSQSLLTTHLRTHTGEKPFVCEFCGKGFAQSGNLVVHLRIHWGEKPYQCKFCDKEFTSQSNCNSHQTKKHDGM